MMAHVRKLVMWAFAINGVTLCLTSGIAAQQLPAAGPDSVRRHTVTNKGDSVSIHLSDVDLRAAVQALSPYLDRPVIFGASAAGRVSFESPRPIAHADIPRVLRGIVESQGLELGLDSASGAYRVKTKDPPSPLEPNVNRTVSGPNVPDLFVIRLRHARAVDVAATVNALYGRASALGESSVLGSARGAGPTLSQELNAPQSSAGGQNLLRPPAVVGLSLETAIVPDPRTNSLLIRGSRSDYELILEAVRQLDVRPLQVLIEVLIAEVRLDSHFALGLGAGVPPTTIRSRASINGAVASGVTGGGPAPDSTLGDFVLRVLTNGSGVNFQATLTAAESRGEARILSRPVLIAANNETAEILVGSQQPFIEMQRSLPTDSPIRDQVVQYRDVGTKLTVRPTISSDGYVVLAVTQEVNQATSEVQFDAPVISTRTVQTQLLVRDSQTVILGGLSDKEKDRSRSGVPLLSRIPVLGSLFGNTQRDVAETEFFLFITPRIIYTDEDADSLTAPLKQRARKGQP